MTVCSGKEPCDHERISSFSGLRVVKNEVFLYLPDVGNFEESVLPMFAKQGKLKVVKFGNPDYYWRSIDSHWDWKRRQRVAAALSGT